jgi:hypothetical protein
MTIVYLHIGFSNMVVTKMGGTQSCEVVTERRCGGSRRISLIHVLSDQQSQPLSLLQLPHKDSMDWTVKVFSLYQGGTILKFNDDDDDVSHD